MTGTLAQIIALAAYGHDYLKNGTVPADFSSANSTFQFCNKVDFREFRKPFLSSTPKEKIVAKSPAEWFEHLKVDGCKQLRLYFESSKDQRLAKDHKLAGLVGGGGTWLIEAVYDHYSNYWGAHWEVTDQNAVDNKIWTVSYGMFVMKQESNNLQIDNESIKNKLWQTLTDISNFALTHNLNDWAEIFEKAKTTLDSFSPEDNYYHKDLIPYKNYSLTAKQILFSAGSAWVFGGMGSWNDLGFERKEDHEIYETLSERLYSNINEAIIAATNTY